MCFEIPEFLGQAALFLVAFQAVAMPAPTPMRVWREVDKPVSSKATQVIA